MFAIGLLLPLAIRQTDDFNKTWDQVSNAIRTRFYAREARKSEMDKILEQYGPKAKASKTRPEFEANVNEMIHAFHDSHFDFLTKADQGYYLMQSLTLADKADPMPEFGAWFAHTGDGFEVRMVLEGGEAAKAGIRKGDVIKTVDGDPFTPIESLKSKVGNKATLGATRGIASMIFNVTVEQKTCLQMFLDASNNSSRVIDVNGHKIGYFHLWTQANDYFKNALSAAVYGKLRDTDGFILDLRDGFGGRPEGYGDPFFRPDFWVDWNSGPKDGYSQLFGYGRPLVVLINSGSRSAKEILSYAFKESRRGTLIGRKTAGNVLGTYPQKLNDWAYIEIPVVDVVVQGTRLENNGVAPDVLIPQEMDSNGTDLDLKAGLERLRNVRPHRADPAKPVQKAPISG